MDLLPGMDRLPMLRSQRIVLRWLTPEDAPDLFRIFGDAEVCRYWSRPPLSALAAAEELQREIAELFERRTLFQWGIAGVESNVVMGTVTLTSFAPDEGRAEVGFALARSAWGQGFATEALSALIDYAFGEMDLRVLEADVDPANHASTRVLERLGFRFHGVQPSRYQSAGVTLQGALYVLIRPG